MKFEITDSQVFRTAYFTIEDDNGTVYLINLTEGEFGDDWSITDEDHNNIEDEDLCSRLINICESYLND
jgi:hypothetical protein